MTVLCILYLSFLYLVQYPAQCYHIRRASVAGTLTLNEYAINWFDTSGNGTFAWEPLKKYTTVDTKFIFPAVDGYWSTRIGDVILYSDKKVDVEELLNSAELGPSIFKEPPGDKKTPEVNANLYFRRVQFKEGTNNKIGYMITTPPNPDPLSQLGDLTQGPLLNGVPAGLRSEVNPAVQVPSPTQGCKISSGCRLNIPVSIRGPSLAQSRWDSHVAPVCRCLLLRPQTNKYGLPCSDNECPTGSQTASSIDVCCHAQQRLRGPCRELTRFGQESSVHVRGLSTSTGIRWVSQLARWSSISRHHELPGWFLIHSRSTTRCSASDEIFERRRSSMSAHSDSKCVR